MHFDLMELIAWKGSQLCLTIRVITKPSTREVHTQFMSLEVLDQNILASIFILLHKRMVVCNPQTAWTL